MEISNGTRAIPSGFHTSFVYILRAIVKTSLKRATASKYLDYVHLILCATACKGWVHSCLNSVCLINVYCLARP